MPESIRFLLILVCLGACGYAAAWALSTFPPEQTEVVKPLNNVDFSQ